jgi:hypothetical protein
MHVGIAVPGIRCLCIARISAVSGGHVGLESSKSSMAVRNRGSAIWYPRETSRNVNHNLDVRFGTMVESFSRHLSHDVHCVMRARMRAIAGHAIKLYSRSPGAERHLSSSGRSRHTPPVQ